MFVTAAITVLCTTGVAFYARFLAALCRECKARQGGHWVRLRLGSGEDALVEMQEPKKSVPSCCVRDR